jgi:hypothetical protein
MTYAFVQDVPADPEFYAQIRARIGDEAPKGLVLHLALQREGGLRYIDVWDSEQDWERFHYDVIEPVVTELLAGIGIPHDHSQVTSEPLDVVHIWLGERTAAA